MTEYVFGSMAEHRNKGAERGEPCRVWEACLDWDLASVCMSMLSTPNPFHRQCSQETTALPLLLVVHVVKMLLPCLFFALLPQPSSFPHSCLLACLARAPLPRIFTPMFCLFTSCCAVHAQGVCGVFFLAR